MAEFLFPGVYVEEIPFKAKPIEGVPTSTATMVGLTAQGPDHPLLVTGFDGFSREFGSVASPSQALCDRWTRADEGGQWWDFPLAVKGFFENGGRGLYIKRVCREDLNDLTIDDFVAAIESLNEVGGMDLCLAPGIWSSKVLDALIRRCETRRDCFAILDPPNNLDIAGILNFRRHLNTSFAALYYPWIEVPDLNSGTVQIGPSAHVAGVYVRVDEDLGVHKAPANEVIRGINKLVRNVTGDEQKLLDPEGINALRFFPERGNSVWGARTLSPDPEWKYVNIRRYFIYLERSIDKGTQWAVFEPNDEPLWARVRQQVSDFLLGLWRGGALQGTKAEEAFLLNATAPP